MAVNFALANEWRAFRASLISRGLDDPSEDENASQAQKSVAPKNEELLRLQNPTLAEEYLSGAWVGGLLVRNALEGELLKCPNSYWGQKLLDKLSEEASGTGEEDEEVKEESAEARKLRLETWQNNIPYMYRLAETLMVDELSGIIDRNGVVGPDGRTAIDPRRCSPEELGLLTSYQEQLDSWQEVVLVTSISPQGCQGVVINRPFRLSVDVSLAQRLLKPTGFERFSEAFAQHGAVYVGGPDNQGDRALFLHHHELP
eukprot:gene14033-16588_t